MSTENEHQGGTPPQRGVELGRAPSHAERSRTLVASQQSATLCTLARDPAGHPYGSLVLYALDEAGRPLLVLSGLAEHTRNLDADPRASLLVCEAAGHDDALALGRVTLLGRAERVPEADLADARARVTTRNAANERYLAMRDFAIWRLSVESARYIGGYGRMSWVSSSDYQAAHPDPLAADVAGIVRHMNDDHGHNLAQYARAHAGLADAVAATMTAIDRYGFDMVVSTGAGPRTVRLGFAAPVENSEQARAELVRMAREARAKLGLSS